jgi:hypothetical protein
LKAEAKAKTALATTCKAEERNQVNFEILRYPLVVKVSQCIKPAAVDQVKRKRA